MTITTEEVAARWPALLEKIDKGEEIKITRQGVTVANLVSVTEPEKLTPAEAIERLRELRKGVRLNGLSIRELIDEGR